jgi:hypothetical protein
MSDRYLRIVLTIIAVELGWIGVKDLAPGVAAQAQPPATRVVITGVDMPPARPQFLPVRVEPGERALRVESGDRGLRVEAGDRPLRIEGAVNARVVEPIHVDTSQPLNVRAVVQTSARPGI